MKVDMRDQLWWKSAFRYLITTLIYAFVIATVFFAFSGDWTFLTSFQYYVTTFTTTFFAMFLRFLWCDKGEAVALNIVDDIKAKEDAKKALIGKVVDNNLVGELEDFAIKETKINKETEYQAKLDKKVAYLKKGWYKPFRVYRYNVWVERRNEFLDYKSGLENDFNLDNIRISHYKVTIDDLLSVSHIQKTKDKKKRYNKSKKIFSSYQTNILTFIGSAIVGGANVFIKNFVLEDLMILLSQVIIFTLNIYSGYNIGLNGILQDYSTDLSDDYTLLKRFLKLNDVS